MDSFNTTYDNDYQWRPSVPFLNIPKQPPKDTQPRKGIYMRRPVEGACTCDGHGWEPQQDHYRCLADKERRLCSDLVALRKDMTDLCNSIMDHPCGDAETKLESLYRSDYKVKGFTNTTFRKLMAAADSPVGVPIAPLDIGLNYAYRDPTSFRYLPIVRPNVNPSRPITFGVTPHSCNEWFQPLPVRTEYQDTISKVGRAIVKSRQQYREPMPSTRRRPDDPCL